GDGYVDISTVSETVVENSDVPEDDGTEPEPPPEPTRIPLDEQFGILEYDDFFLLVYGKSVVYIIPAENFTEEEKDTVRNLKSQES
ncbi:MAG: YcxB family protein, partial [Ruminococcus sp.]|nr:YcxB family protein [Ruminococcus sp.]